MQTDHNFNIDTDFNTDLEYVGFWVRFMACLIDALLWMILIVPILLFLYGPDVVVMYMDDTSLFLHHEEHRSGFLFNWLLPAIVIIVFWITKSATPGKMIFGVFIVDARTGAKPTVGKCVGRYFGYFVSAIVLCLGFLWIVFDERKQGWHDKLAETIVVRPYRGGKRVSF